MTRAKCSYCQKEAEKSELKKCSRCRYLLYCSRDCQILSWKTTHRYTCRERITPDEDDKDSAREDRNLTSWLNAWSATLCNTAIAALDLANHDADYLINHCLYLELNKTGHKTDARRFTISEMRISHVEPLRTAYPGLASMLTDPPELVGKRVRYLVVVKNSYGEVEQGRARVWMDGNIEVYRNMEKERCHALAMGLMAGLLRSVEDGEIGAIPSLFKSAKH